MTEAQSISAKYIFLDIVSYSFGRSVEAQTEIITALNSVVRDSVAQFKVGDEQIIYLPTGDGICVALLGVEQPYDIHVQLALEILKRLEAYNVNTVDQMRNFQVRIGLNANVDNLVTDINGKRNVAGAGINLAQRVMNAADGNQILVGESVYETLRHREKYMNVFKSFNVTVKHGVRLRVHQLIGRSTGLDFSMPSQFEVQEDTEPRLSKLAAYYFAHAVLNKEFLKRSIYPIRNGWEPNACIILLYMLAVDSVGASASSDTTVYTPHIWGAGKASLDEQFKHYDSYDPWVLHELSTFIDLTHLSDFETYFEPGRPPYRHFITREGREKLRKDHPAIWKEFGFKTAV